MNLRRWLVGSGELPTALRRESEPAACSRQPAATLHIHISHSYSYNQGRRQVKICGVDGHGEREPITGVWGRSDPPPTPSACKKTRRICINFRSDVYSKSGVDMSTPVHLVATPLHTTQYAGADPAICVRGARPPFPLEVGSPRKPARGSGERCKLPERGLGRSPGRKRIWCTLKLVAVTVSVVKCTFYNRNLAQECRGGVGPSPKKGEGLARPHSSKSAADT